MRNLRFLPLIFLLIRILLFLSIPNEGLVGYGDLEHFFGWSQLEGWPFLDYWMEFPPVFPLLAEIIYRIVGGREHAFYTLLAFLFSIVQAINIHLFVRIAEMVSPSQAEKKTWVYFGLIAGLFYGWSYFDPLAVSALLLGLWFMISDKPYPAALSFGVGALIKWFPLMGLFALIRKYGFKRWQPVMLALMIIASCWSFFYIVSPEFTSASLQSQLAKGSWETVWALIDGNLGTGNFGLKSERFNAAAATLAQGNPSLISPIVTFMIFAMVGAWVFTRSRIEHSRETIAFTGITLSLFFLWSPGWSPQWVLFIIPFVMILLPYRTGILVAASFVLINLLEWPLLLSRGLFWGLYFTIPIRTLLLLLITWQFWLMIKNSTGIQNIRENN